MRREIDLLVREWPLVPIEAGAFYHTMDLPNGTVEGQWDLRGRMPEYIGNVDVAGKRVLDYGCASGFLTFEMERLGAREVVSFDADIAERIAFLPVWNHPYNTAPTQWRRDNDRFLERLKNSYWHAHQQLGSKAACYYGDAYDLPQGLGGFDVVVVAAILIHLRDPITAVGAAARMCDDTLVITEDLYDSTETVAKMNARAVNGGPPYIWWSLSEPALREIVAMCGFEVQSVTTSKYLCKQHEYMTGETELSTLVAKRVRP